MMQKLRGFAAKYKALPVTVRASFFFVLSGAMKDAVDVVTTPIFTRLLTLDEYGLFHVYNSWYQLLRILVSLYIFSDGFNVGMARYGEDREGFTSSQQGLASALFLIWGAVFLIWRSRWEALLGLSGSLILLMLIQILFTTAFNCWQQKKKYTYDYRILALVVIVYTLLQPLLGIAAIRLNKGGISNALLRIYSGVGVQIVFGFVVFVLQFLRRPTVYNKTYWRFALKTSLPLTPHYLSQVLLNQSDRLMINAFVGAAQTSIYSVAHAAAFALHMVTANINSTFVPWLYERLKRGSTEGVRRITGLLVVFAAAAAAMLVLVAPEAMAILGDGKYAEGKWIIPSLTYSVYLIFVYTLFADFELFYGRNLFVLYSSVLGALANIVLNYLMIPRYGYFAAGYTTVVGYLLMCGGHLFFLRRTCRAEGLNMAALFHLPLIAAVSLALAAFCALVMLLYRVILPRYLLLALMLAVIVWKRRALMKLYTGLKKKQEL